MSSAEAYPLAWPVGWRATLFPRRSRFKGNFATVRDGLVREIKRLGGSYIVLSTNVPLKRDGYPYANYREPLKTGVAVYFLRKGKQMVFACDKWNRVQDNMRAIQQTISAIRGMERWGASEMMERTFHAFEALSAPVPRTCWDVLNIRSGSSRDDINRAYRVKAAHAHPDVGGSNTVMAELNNARDDAIRFSMMNKE